jgi:hypothetical protein
VTKYRLAALALVLIQAGCTSLREAEHPISTPDPSIPTTDVSVEVEELPGLFQVTERR